MCQKNLSPRVNFIDLKGFKITTDFILNFRTLELENTSALSLFFHLNSKLHFFFQNSSNPFINLISKFECKVFEYI